MRQGNCRILYSVHDTHVLVVVITIGHRRVVYR
jgi:mRNA-degrading endonuclease RelE of RelBE toxin-antitoxin system